MIFQNSPTHWKTTHKSLMCWTDPKQMCWGKQGMRKWREWKRETGRGNEKDCEKSDNLLINPNIQLNKKEVTALNVKLLDKDASKSLKDPVFLLIQSKHWLCSVYSQIMIVRLFICRECRTIRIPPPSVGKWVQTLWFFWRALFTTADAWGRRDDVRAVTWPNRSQ